MNYAAVAAMTKEVGSQVHARTPRFRELDGLRGLAALSVVIGHFTATFSTFYPEAPGSLFDFAHGHFGVQLFFMISGFVILMTVERAKRHTDFVISRVTRLYPAYWIAVILSIFVGLLANVPGTQLSVIDTLLNFTMVQRLLLVPDVNGAFWTLAIEMQFYAIVLVILVATRCMLSDKLVQRLALVWLMISVAVSVVAAVLSPDTSILNAPVLLRALVNLTLAEYGPLFALGMLLFIARRNQRLGWAPVVAAGVATLSAGLLHSWGYAAAVAGISLAFTYVALRSSTPVLRFAPLLWLGKISYSLYIVHVVVGYALIDALWPFLGRDLANVFALGGVVLIAWALHTVAEEKLSSAWRKRWTAWRDRRVAARSHGPVH